MSPGKPFQNAATHYIMVSSFSLRPFNVHGRYTFSTVVGNLMYSRMLILREFSLEGNESRMGSA